jgi:protein SCO1/2
MRARLVLLAVCGLVLAGCGGSAQVAAVAQTQQTPFDGVELNPPTRAPEIALRDQNGHAIRLSSLRGKTVFVTFLYVHCPDVCPLIATHLDSALRRLGAKRASGIRILAVSVDPKGDTPAAARRFVKQHDLLPQFHFLLGSRAQLAPVWKAYHVVTFKDPEGTVSHSAFTLLIDASGKERLIYDAQVKPAAVVHDLRQLGAH